MKGIVLAGGTGSRLYPLTAVVNKQLLPVYDKPMILYPIQTLINAGIKDILVITSPQNQDLFKVLLQKTVRRDIHFEYAIQEQPRGIAEAFIIGRDFIGKDDVALILGDNIFVGDFDFSVFKKPTIFVKRVSNASSYGVAEIVDGKVISIEEKPEHPKSDYAVTGLYVYTNDVVDIAHTLLPSERGELEITDINNEYIKRGVLNVAYLWNEKWFDAGTPDQLLRASTYVAYGV